MKLLTEKNMILDWFLPTLFSFRIIVLKEERKYAGIFSYLSAIFARGKKTKTNICDNAYSFIKLNEYTT